MKPNLLIGLGNPLMGDEGIGWHVANRLARDPRVPADTEVLCGGTDLVRHASEMEGRNRVILVDAMQDASQPGSISVFEDDFFELEGRQENAHQLSVAEAVRLLRIASPSLKPVHFTLLAVAIASASINQELSPALSAQMPRILERVLQETTRTPGVADAISR